MKKTNTHCNQSGFYFGKNSYELSKIGSIMLYINIADPWWFVLLVSMYIKLHREL